ncbi:hypothetical protein FQN54_008058 [Arachnomyces sp. PD_36]|nr:hypothetical protein FQN54_008058 [Arachnomyces sp. PD_36]
MAYLSSFNPFSRSTTAPSDSTPPSSSSRPDADRAPSQPPPQQSPSPSPPSTQPRLNNSSKLLLAGATFFALSSLITRRSLARKRVATIPPFYTTASYHRPPVNGAIEALEALNIATINVLSGAMLTVGAGMYGFGIETLEDMRRAVRGGLGIDGTGRSEQDLEEELEEWVVGVMGRKEGKEQQREREKRKVDEKGRNREL